MGRWPRAPHGRPHHLPPTYIKPLCSFAAARTSSYLQLPLRAFSPALTPLHNSTLVSTASGLRFLRPPPSGSSGRRPLFHPLHSHLQHLATSIHTSKSLRFLPKPAVRRHRPRRACLLARGGMRARRWSRAAVLACLVLLAAARAAEARPVPGAEGGAGGGKAAAAHDAGGRRGAFDVVVVGLVSIGLGRRWRAGSGGDELVDEDKRRVPTGPNPLHNR